MQWRILLMRLRLNNWYLELRKMGLILGLNCHHVLGLSGLQEVKLSMWSRLCRNLSNILRCHLRLRLCVLLVLALLILPSVGVAARVMLLVILLILELLLVLLGHLSLWCNCLTLSSSSMLPCKKGHSHRACSSCHCRSCYSSGCSCSWLCCRSCCRCH
uniref:Uncharacterized protein n=1 Tax=Triticum urartu TaxID=4572 RepID=A0A8R7VEW3_TRIUA